MAYKFISSSICSSAKSKAVAAVASAGIVATLSMRPAPVARMEAARGVSGVKLRKVSSMPETSFPQCKAKWETNLSGKMDSDVQQAAEAAKKIGWIPWEEQTLAEIRTGCIQGLAACAQQDKALYWSQQATVDSIAIPASSSASQVDSTLLLRVYKPKGSVDSVAQNIKRPLIMFFHGGGFCICDPIEIFDYACKRLAAMTGCIVCSVQYRQAPEFPFPAAPEDCFHATTWCVEHASELGGDPSLVATCGDSAGGNLAAVVALMARDKGYPKISLQVCLCPITDWDFTTPSYKEFAGPTSSPDLHAAHMHWYARRYLLKPSDITNPLAAPLRAESLQGVAPGVVVNAEFDALRSEGEAYAKRLAEVGRLIRCTTYPGVMHDFYLRFQYSKSDQAWEELAQDVRNALLVES